MGNPTPTVRKRKLGKRRVPERPGDKKQARDRVAYLVRCGLLPKATSLPCKGCRRNTGYREYHHHKGYGVGCHDKVIPLCRYCHAHADNQQLNKCYAQLGKSPTCDIPD